MRRKRILATAVLLVLCVLWAAPAFAATYATVRGGWLRLRANAGYDATIIKTYPTGTVVTVLSRSNGWARVLTPDYRVGYMDERYLNFGSTPTATPAPTAKPYTRTWTEVNRTAYVTSQNGRDVRLRSSPEVNSTNIIGLYPVGREVREIRRSSDGWSYIRISQRYGYMMSQFLTGGTPTPVPTAEPTPTHRPRPTSRPSHHPRPTAEPTPTPTPSPTPESRQIQMVKLDPYQPTVGDTIRILVTPSNADYTAVWYNDQNILLSTSRQYTVREADAGHVINVRIQGVGLSAGVSVDASTGTVKAKPTAEPEPEVVSEWVDSLYTDP